MPYSLVDVEVTDALPPISVPAGATGLGLILRRRRRPVGFVMRALPAGSVIRPDELAALASAEAGTILLQESLREELVTRAAERPAPSLTVAICTRDRTDRLGRCLQTLLPLRQPAPGGAPRFEILVVDNAPSNDRTATLVGSMSHVRYVLEPRPGLDFARNRAVREATREFLAFVDDDVTVDALWYEGFTDAWTENPDAGAFTGLVLPFELATEAQILFEQRGGFRRGFSRLRYSGQTLPGNPAYPTGAGLFGAGCNMAFRRDLLVRLGGFDEALDTGAPLPGGGDLDIFFRVLRAGAPLVYEPNLLVYHQHRREMAKLRRQYWTWGLAFTAFVAKSWGSDPSQRRKFVALMRWWLADQLRQIGRSVRGRQSFPASLLVVELAGGVVGFLGTYDRSLRRSERIRKQFA